MPDDLQAFAHGFKPFLANCGDCGDGRKRRRQRGSQFRKALLREGMECLLAGDVKTGKVFLGDYINATVGFSKLAEVTRRSPKGLMRMLGPEGNPNARNLFEIVAYLQPLPQKSSGSPVDLL